MEFSKGDMVRVSLDEDDVDAERYDGRVGEITEVVEDDLDGLTGDEKDGYIYTVAFTLGDEMGFRHHDLEPA